MNTPQESTCWHGQPSPPLPERNAPARLPIPADMDDAEEFAARVLLRGDAPDDDTSLLDITACVAPGARTQPLLCVAKVPSPKPPTDKSDAPSGGRGTDPNSSGLTVIWHDTGEATPASAPGAQALVGCMLGDYRLVRKLGEGGMGAVYKARQLSLDRVVAVKVLCQELAAHQPAVVHRFLREARVMAQLNHPNLLHCYEVNQSAGLHFFAMEYASNGSMQDWLQKLRRLTPGDAVHVTLCSARAIHHVHRQNLVHRDIKPENVLVTADGVVKVADLGLVKNQEKDLAPAAPDLAAGMRAFVDPFKDLAKGMDLTRTGLGAGTPVFMSPEQGRDLKRVDRRSDIYSLGCMLYCLLAGQPPYAGETLGELLKAKAAGAHYPTGRFNSLIPAELDRIIDRMIAPDPDNRYQDCAELIRALEELAMDNGELSFLHNDRVRQRPSVSERRSG